LDQQTQGGYSLNSSVSCLIFIGRFRNLGLSREDFLNYSVLLPPKAIQSAFDAFDSRIESKIANNRIQSRTLATLRDTLLPKLLSGELSVVNLEN